MNLHIIALGKGMPIWVEQAFTSYQKRLPADCPLYLKELKAIERSGNANISAILDKEALQLNQATPKGALKIVLDEKGQDITTVKLSHLMTTWQEQSLRDVVFYIGSTDGLAPSFKESADVSLRLSSLTLPHMLVRVLLAEQLYRAWSILNNHPYHRI